MKREDAPQFYCCVHRRMSSGSVSSEECVPTGVLHGWLSGETAANKVGRCCKVGYSGRNPAE
jgi:hypothetical protein